MLVHSISLHFTLRKRVQYFITSSKMMFSVWTKTADLLMSLSLNLPICWYLFVVSSCLWGVISCWLSLPLAFERTGVIFAHFYTDVIFVHLLHWCDICTFVTMMWYLYICYTDVIFVHLLQWCDICTFLTLMWYLYICYNNVVFVYLLHLCDICTFVTMM
jgi:hypothetical protein